jgi:hypothetical protein
MMIQAGCVWAEAERGDPMLSRTTLPITYHIDWTGDYFTKPEKIKQFRTAPPDLLHVGKAVPITHHWGPIRLYKGENQYTGGPGHTLNWENIALLIPTALEDRIITIRQMLERYHAIGIPEIMPYISYHTIAGDHKKRRGFWAFFDQWEKYTQWAGPRPPRDPFDWLVVDINGKFVGGSCGGYSPAYYAPLHRYRACINHPDWAEWHRRLIRMIAEVGYDGCFVDNTNSDTCYCRYCKKGFIKFIEESKDISWVQRLTQILQPKQITLDSPIVPGELVQRWRWMRTRDHLGMLREVGRKIRPGFTIFPNHGILDSALIVGAKCDRLMFEGTFSPGINVKDVQGAETMTITVSNEKAELKQTKKFVYRYKLYDQTSHMEMKAETKLSSRAWVGYPTRIEVKIISVGNNPQDNDAAEAFHIILREPNSGEKIRLGLEPSGPIGGKGSSRKPRQAPVTLEAEWVPKKAGQYKISLGFRYTDDSHEDVTRLRPRLDRLGWVRFCRDHMAELLFTQHMHARTIYLGNEARQKGWENVQELALAELAAFSGGGGFSGLGRPQAKYREFFKKHPYLFDGWQQCAPAAVLYAAWGSNPFTVVKPNLSDTIHSHLAESNRLFVALVDANLTCKVDELLSFRIIYLPSPDYEMTTAQIHALVEYTRQGGQIVLGSDRTKINSKAAVDVFFLTRGETIRTIGKGRIALWEPDHPLMPTRPVATSNGLRRNLRFALYQKGDKLCLHVVNYNVCLLDKAKKVLEIPAQSLEVPLPKGWTSAKATCFDPDAAAKTLSCKLINGRTHLLLPEIRIYKVVLIEKE